MPETSRSRQPHSAVPDQAPAAEAVIGAGTIGLSWARLFASCGSTVTVFEPREDLQDALAAAARDAGLPEEALSRAESIEAAVAEADFVQESGPEDPQGQGRTVCTSGSGGTGDRAAHLLILSDHRHTDRRRSAR